jgi:unsaturated rhamnogalacturonyl hydrolase
MKKTVILFMLLGLAASAIAQTPLRCAQLCDNVIDPQPEMLYSQLMVNSQAMNSAGTALKETDWSYVPGLTAKAVIKAWERDKTKTNYYNAVKSYADDAIGSNNKINIAANDIDALNAGKILFDIYKEEKRKDDLNGTSNATKYQTAITDFRDRLSLAYDHAYDHQRISATIPNIGPGVSGAGGFWHKADYPNQMWLDGIYMGSALYAEWLSIFGQENTAEWADVVNQFNIIHRKTWNATDKLNYHAWSADPTDTYNTATVNSKKRMDSFWANPTTGTSPEYWARANGWFIAALVDVLESMEVVKEDTGSYPAGRDDLLLIFRQVADGLKERQHSTAGVWCQLLQYPVGTEFDGDNFNPNSVDNGTTACLCKKDTDGDYNNTTKKNHFESSASCMFAYAFLKGVRLGLFDESIGTFGNQRAIYETVAKKAYLGSIKNFVTGTTTLSIGGICRSAGVGGDKDNVKRCRDGSPEYYLFYTGNEAGDIVSNEGKGIGTFIMASLEYEQLFPAGVTSADLETVTYFSNLGRD